MQSLVSFAARNAANPWKFLGLGLLVACSFTLSVVHRSNASGDEPAATPPPVFDCGSVYEIPIEECLALVALYDSTAGEFWNERTDWLTTYTPCSWTGVACVANHVTDLTLSSNNLVGTIPMELGDLSQLETLNLGLNQLSGSIPSELGNLALLYDLVLNANELTGPIPTEIGNLTNLRYLYLSGNHINGSIPTQVGNLTELIELELHGNQLNGEIPAQIGNLTQLTTLYLHWNALIGEIPLTLTNLTLLNPSYTSLAYNRLRSSDPAVLAFLAVKDPDWANTQTVPPQDVDVINRTDSAIELSWTPILYTSGVGYYQVKYGPTPIGPFYEHGTTANKLASGYTLNVMPAGETYYIFVSTYTAAQGSQQSDLWSEISEVVPGATLPVAPADFDADRISDVVVFRGGAWRFFDYGTAAFDHGVWTGTAAGCFPAPMDYNGDGAAEFTQLCNGAWHFYHDDGSYYKGIWTGGVAGDLPVPADYDGDGADDVVVWRAGAWRFFDFASGSFDHGVWTGAPPHWLGGTSLPVPMDYDGDGRAEFGVWSGGPWHFYNDDGSYNKGIWTGGVAGDLPAPGDYDSDGTEEVVVWRAGAWRFFDFTSASFDHGVWTGAPPHWLGGTPLPAPVDVDGDGALNFTVWSGGPWHFYDASGVYVKGIWTGGVAGDLPISRRMLP